MKFEIMCKQANGDEMFCGIVGTQGEADIIIKQYQMEFPENQYWFEIDWRDE